MKSLSITLFLVFLGLSQAHYGIYSSGCVSVATTPLAISTQTTMQFGKSGQSNFYQGAYSIYIANNCTQAADSSLTFTGTFSESSSTVNAVFASNNASASSSTYGITATWSSYAALANSALGIVYIDTFCNISVTEGQSFDLGATGCAGMNLLPISQCSTTYSSTYSSSNYIYSGNRVYGSFAQEMLLVIALLNHPLLFGLLMTLAVPS